MEQMRISCHCGDFTLYEILISITSVVIISGLITEFLLSLLNRLEFFYTANQFKDTPIQANLQDLTKLKSHLTICDSEILRFKKSAKNYQTISKVKRPEEISVSANRWTSFSKFAFRSGGSIVIENED